MFPIEEDCKYKGPEQSLGKVESGQGVAGTPGPLGRHRELGTCQWEVRDNPKGTCSTQVRSTCLGKGLARPGSV